MGERSLATTRASIAVSGAVARPLPELEIGLAHAVGAALRPVLRPLVHEAPPRLLVAHRSRPKRPAFEAAEVNGGESRAARGRQLYTGRNARSARCRLNGICQKIHGMSGNGRGPRRAIGASGGIRNG